MAIEVVVLVLERKLVLEAAERSRLDAMRRYSCPLVSAYLELRTALELLERCL